MRHTCTCTLYPKSMTVILSGPKGPVTSSNCPNLRGAEGESTVARKGHRAYKLYISHTNFIFRIQTLYFAYKLYISHTNFIFRIQTLYFAYKLYISHTNFIFRIQTLYFAYKLYMQTLYSAYLKKGISLTLGYRRRLEQFPAKNVATKTCFTGCLFRKDNCLFDFRFLRFVKNFIFRVQTLALIAPTL